MISVALIGPDGSGKTTIAKRLETSLPVPAKYLYMGVSLDSSSSMLVTSRLVRRVKRALGARPDTAGPRDSRQQDARPSSPLRRVAKELWSLASLANRIAEEWYRQILVWSHQWRGRVVLFDRHYFPDYYAFDIKPSDRPRSLSRRIHGWMLGHVYPKPQLLIFLDAPAEVLHARKGEGTVEVLERRRREYLELATVVPDFATVDATQSEDEVTAEVSRLICERVDARRRATGVARRDRSGTVLVTDARRGSAIAFLRSLGRQGWRVIAADSDPRSAGFRSRCAAGRVTYPDPALRPEAFVDALLEAVRHHGVDLVVPITDETILPLSRSRQRFEGVCRLALPEADALEVVGDKRQTTELAERLGVPVPRTRLVHTPAEALAAAESLGWPVVLKPQRSRVQRHGAPLDAFEVEYADEPERLAEQMRRFEGRCAVLLQEYLEGTGHGVEILAEAGRPIAAFQHERLREVPPHGGRSALRRSVRLDPVLFEHSVRLLRAVNWTGLAMVEFRVGPKGAALMEINGRVWGSLPLAVHSGMDFPARLVELYLGEPPNPDALPDRSYRVGVRARNLELDVKWIASVLLGARHPVLPWPPRREALRAAAQLLDPRIRFDIQSLRDPLPGLVDLARIGRQLAARLPGRPDAREAGGGRSPEDDVSSAPPAA